MQLTDACGWEKVIADIIEAIIGASYMPNKDLDSVIAILHNLMVPLNLFKTWDDVKHVLPHQKQRSPRILMYRHISAFSKNRLTKFWDTNLKTTRSLRTPSYVCEIICHPQANVQCPIRAWRRRNKPEGFEKDIR